MDSVINEYYRAVDDGDIETVLELFSHDAVYERPGYPPMQGQSELRKFYTQERIIAAGKHRIDMILTCNDNHVAIGRFSGTLRDGQVSCVGFADHFVISNSKIYRRCTYFYTPAV